MITTQQLIMPSPSTECEIATGRTLIIRARSRQAHFFFSIVAAHMEGGSQYEQAYLDAYMSWPLIASWQPEQPLILTEIEGFGTLDPSGEAFVTEL
jgi:hypothetical protein